MTYAFNPYASIKANTAVMQGIKLEDANQETKEVAQDQEVTQSQDSNSSLKVRKRARAKGGEFIGDNPETAQNEAWQE